MQALLQALVLLLAAFGAPSRGPIPPGEPPPEVAAVARTQRHAPLPDRIATIAATLDGRPYLLDPAGEGAGHDLDPPGRFDAFDCLSFVEEVLALALAATPTDAGRIRHALRYGDVVGPEHADRRHFMEAEWLPGAVRDGWLRETSASYGTTIRLEQELDTDAWNRWPQRSSFPHPDPRLPTGSVGIDVLPLQTAREIAADIHPGSVVAIARVGRPDRPFWVTHIGFVVAGEGGPLLRHASQMRSRRQVTTHDLVAYLAHLDGYRRWPVAGIAVFEPVEQGPPRAPRPVQPEITLSR